MHFELVFYGYITCRVVNEEHRLLLFLKNISRAISSLVYYDVYRSEDLRLEEDMFSSSGYTNKCRVLLTDMLPIVYSN